MVKMEKIKGSGKKQFIKKNIKMNRKKNEK